MSQNQLRVYTLRSPEALVAYENIWAQHIPGMAKHRIATHGVWTVPAAPGSEAPSCTPSFPTRTPTTFRSGWRRTSPAPNSAQTWRVSTSVRSVGVAESVLTPTADSPLR